MKRSKTTKPWTPCTYPAQHGPLQHRCSELKRTTRIGQCTDWEQGWLSGKPWPPTGLHITGEHAQPALPHLRHFGRARWRPDPPFLQARRQIYSVLRRTRRGAVQDGDNVHFNPVCLKTRKVINVTLIMCAGGQSVMAVWEFKLQQEAPDCFTASTDCPPWLRLSAALTQLYLHTCTLTQRRVEVTPMTVCLLPPGQAL